MVRDDILSEILHFGWLYDFSKTRMDWSLPLVFGSRQRSLAPAWDKISAMDTQREYVLSSSWPSAKLLSSYPTPGYQHCMPRGLGLQCCLHLLPPHRHKLFTILHHVVLFGLERQHGKVPGETGQDARHRNPKPVFRNPVCFIRRFIDLRERFSVSAVEAG